MSPSMPLISKVLHRGDSVRIGRKSSCEVMVKSPFVSGVHCRIDVTGSKDSTAPGESQLLPSINKNGGLHFFISDLSSNGTWLLKDSSRSLHDANLTKMLSTKDSKLAKKLATKTKEELQPGDCILLLAPGHKECAQYRFMVKMMGSECILEQLPNSWNDKSSGGSHGSTSTAVMGKSFASVGDLEDSRSESSTVSRKRSTVSAHDDETAKKPRLSSTPESWYML